MQPNFRNITAAGTTYLDPESPPCHLHWRDPLGFWNFWCPVTGGVSGTSSSPRTEYRETEADSSAQFNWLPEDFISSRLDGLVDIRLLPSSEKVIFAQVHAYKAPTPFVKLMQKGKELTAEVRFRPGDTASPTVIRIPMEDASANYTIEVTGDSQLLINLEGEVFQCPIDPEWAQYPFFFKAGAYCIDSEGPETEGAWVVYERLNVIHE